MDRCKLVVVNEWILGYITPNNHKDVQILHASELRGCPNSWIQGNVPIKPSDSIRLATEKDFNDYRVSFVGFNNPKEFIYRK